MADRRRKAGNVRGAAEMAVRLGTVDPEDFDARYAAAKAARELGDDETALRELRAAALGFEEKARHDLARAAYRDILELAAGRRGRAGPGARRQHRHRRVLQRLRAGVVARGAAPARRALEAAGQQSEVLSVWARIADLDPADIEARVRLVRGYLATGDTVAARRHLSAEVAQQEPSLWMALAETELRQGRFDEGRAAVASALAANPAQREAAVAMACRLAEQSPDSAYPGIEAVTDAALAEGDYAAAAAALHEFVTRVRRHIVALMRLVEICVDGGLEATMYSAQAQLADAYLDAGRGLEARIISEDLVAREPWDRANIERFRRALEMLGEADPDAIIADRLSGESPFMATDKMDLNEGIDFDTPAPSRSPSRPPRRRTRPSRSPTTTRATRRAKRGRGGKARSDGAPEEQKAQDEELAAEQLRLAHTYRDMGMVDDAIQSLERAAKSSRQRFEAASLLGRMHVERGERSRALDWFERAAEAPAPTADAGRALLYDLADTLESLGEAGPGAGRVRRARRRRARLSRRRAAHRAPEPRAGPGVGPVPAAARHRPAHRVRAAADRRAVVGVLGAQLLLPAVAGARTRCSPTTTCAGRSPAWAPSTCSGRSPICPCWCGGARRRERQPARRAPGSCWCRTARACAPPPAGLRPRHGDLLLEQARGRRGRRCHRLPGP